MPTPEEARRALKRLFHSRRILNLKGIFQALKTRSTMTAFRRLSELDYLSSYSHAGRYYTLSDIPRFDPKGLWLYEGKGFSRHGTLKETVVVLVDRSEAGLFHRDLQTLLQVRVHNTLLDQVREKRIGRKEVAKEYLYVSSEPRRAEEQVARHRIEAAVAPAPPPPTLVIEILIEVIHSTGIRGDPGAVCARLKARGVVVAVEQVQEVFLTYSLPQKKTIPSPSTRSPR